MTSSQPYQPLLLRILHGVTAIFLIAAILTAYWTYDVYDGRWGRIPLPQFKEIEGIHGTFGLYTLLIFPVFVLYAFHRGQRRLIQSDFLTQLTQVGRPIWGYTLSRITNTLAVLALTFSLFSGKMMNSAWLPKGELNHGWYYAHLIGWVITVVCIALHVLINAKVGGLPFLLSMWNWRFQAKDSPKLWSRHISAWWTNLQFNKGAWKQSGAVLLTLEVFVLGSILAAWIISSFK